jgi:hypothetical protein
MISRLTISRAVGFRAGAVATLLLVNVLGSMVPCGGPDDPKD